MMLQATGLKMRHLPTTGGGPAVTQALGGHAQLTAGGLAAVYPYVSSNKLRAIASMGAKTAAALPNVPTLLSMKYDVEAYLWVGIFTTAGVPAPIMTKMREMVGKVANDPVFRQALENVQVVPDYRDAPEFKKFFDADYKRLAAAVQKIGKID
jgi:tripartite-type tricarboxylate transporter receptor subunit TctC